MSRTNQDRAPRTTRTSHQQAARRSPGELPPTATRGNTEPPLSLPEATRRHDFSQLRGALALLAPVRNSAAQPTSAAASHTTASYAVASHTYATRKNPRRLASQSLRSFALGRQSRCRQTLYAQDPPLRGALTSFAEHSHAHKFAAHLRTREPLRSRSTGGLPSL